MRLYLFWAALAVALLFILINPFWGIVVYGVMNILRPELLFWGGSSQAANSMVLVFGATGISLFLHSGKIRFSQVMKKEIFYLCWLCLGVYLSVAFASYTVPLQTDFAYEILKILLFCLAIVLVLDSPKKFLLFTRVLTISFVLLAIWGIEQNFRGNYRLEKLGGYDSNGIAAMFVLYFPIMVESVMNPASKKERMGGIVGAGSLFLALVFTKSRGGLLGIIASLIGYFYFSKKKMKIIGLFAILSVFLVPYIAGQYADRMTHIEENESLDASAESRLYLWQFGLLIFADNPLFGTGLLTYPYAKFEYASRFEHLDPRFYADLFRTVDPKVTHNTYIKYLADCGLMAAAPYFLLILGTVWSNRKLRRKYSKDPGHEKSIALLNAIECGIWGNCISNFFIDANFMIFPYVQMVVCASIREYVLSHRAAPSEVPRSLGAPVGPKISTMKLP